MSARIIWLALASSLVVAAATGQGDDKPAGLRLKGDPAQDMDLGATRLVPMALRETEKGPITRSPYICLQAIEKGTQVLEAGKARQPSRLLGRSTSSVLPWLNRLDDMKPTLIWTPRWTLVAFLGNGKEPGLTPEESVRLRTWFPNLSKRSTRLSGHQRAHLWAIRLLRTESAIGELLNLDSEARLRQRTGSYYRPLSHRSCEVYLFSSRSAHDAFCEHAFKSETDGLSGEVLGASGPVTAVLMDDISPGSARRRRFLHGASLQLLRVHRRLEGGVPPWLEIGISHYFERRLQTASPQKRDEARTLPDDIQAPRDWDQAVRDLVASGRSGRLAALSATPERGLSLMSHLQAWSLVKYLLGVDPNRFGRLIIDLLHIPPGTPAQNGMRDAIQSAYGHSPQEVEKAWKAWVLKKGK